MLACVAGCGGNGAEAADLCKPALEEAAVATVTVPELTGRVVDNADLLSAATETEVTRDLAAFEQRTSDQVVVVTTASLEGESIERFGRRLGNGWGIGQEKLDNGVLLLIATNERKVRIEVGCGLEGLLTDDRAAAIIDQALLPLLRAGDFDRAVKAGVARILEVLASEARRPVPRLRKKAA
jgi:uncharacterized protein